MHWPELATLAAASRVEKGLVRETRSTWIDADVEIGPDSLIDLVGSDGRFGILKQALEAAGLYGRIVIHHLDPAGKLFDLVDDPRDREATSSLSLSANHGSL